MSKSGFSEFLWCFAILFFGNAFTGHEGIKRIENIGERGDCTRPSGSPFFGLDFLLRDVPHAHAAASSRREAFSILRAGNVSKG